ncbi:Glucanosyltransferase-domain-containing protein [Xylariales sp. PMI_506]|nr:Glucanosyltransferase-domain-containing protein [Xylariales sp. PMI_506]
MFRNTTSQLWPTWLLGLFMIHLVTAAISTISIKGTKLYQENGDQFYVRGVAYNRGSNITDVLADTNQCQVDAGLMKTLGVNTVRVYQANSTLNHDGCMLAFATQGVYVMLDLTSPADRIDPSDPTYTLAMYNGWTAIIDAFAGYDNLLAFNMGNEIIASEGDDTLAAPYVKAAVRDMKAFRNARGYRAIPIAYSAADIQDLRVMQAQYFACGDADDAVDMYGMNLYTWCGNSSYYISGYDELPGDFDVFDIPVLFSETGCTQDGQRDFDDIGTMLGPVFQAVFSGAVAYEWTMEANGYGIVSYSADTNNSGFPVTLSDYNVLMTVLSTATPTGTPRSEYTPSISTPPACPTSTSGVWSVNGNVKLPTIAGLDISSVTARTTITTGTTGTAGTSGTGSAAMGATTTGTSAGANSEDSRIESPSGAIAGITIGAVAVVAAVAAVVFWLLRRKKRRANGGALAAEASGVGKEGYEAVPNSNQLFKVELPAVSAGAVLPRQELDSTAVYRQAAPGPEPARNQNVAYEMDGSAPARYHSG